MRSEARPARVACEHTGSAPLMSGALLWGLVAGSSLVIGGAIALRFDISQRLLGLIMAFGAGVLISAVAYELVAEAFHTSAGSGGVGLGLFAGAVVFFGGDFLIDRMGGEGRKHSGGAQASGSALAIVLGIVLDGIPESIVIGLSLLEGGGVSVAVDRRRLPLQHPRGHRRHHRSARAGWAPRASSSLWGGHDRVRIRVAARLRGLRRRLAATVAFVLAFAAAPSSRCWPTR